MHAVLSQYSFTNTFYQKMILYDIIDLTLFFLLNSFLTKFMPLICFMHAIYAKMYVKSWSGALI